MPVQPEVDTRKRLLWQFAGKTRRRCVTSPPQIGTAPARCVVSDNDGWPVVRRCDLFTQPLAAIEMNGPRVLWRQHDLPPPPQCAQAKESHRFIRTGQGRRRIKSTQLDSASAQVSRFGQRQATPSHARSALQLSVAVCRPFPFTESAATRRLEEVPGHVIPGQTKARRLGAERPWPSRGCPRSAVAPGRRRRANSPTHPHGSNLDLRRRPGWPRQPDATEMQLRWPAGLNGHTPWQLAVPTNASLE